MGGADRIVRVIPGVVLPPLAHLALSGTLAAVACVVGGIAPVTGIRRSCPANALPGNDTCGSKRAGPPQYAHHIPWDRVVEVRRQVEL